MNATPRAVPRTGIQLPGRECDPKAKALTTEGTGSHGVSQNTHRGTGVHRFHHPGHEDAEGLAKANSVIFGNTKTARGK